MAVCFAVLRHAFGEVIANNFSKEVRTFFDVWGGRECKFARSELLALVLEARKRLSKPV